MSGNENNNVVKYRKPLNINIGMLIFAAIFVYIIVCIFGYFTAKHIVPYEVKEGSLTSNNIYQGIALRSEEIVTATQAGYINYYAREGERVGVGNLVYTLDESGKLSEYLNDEGSGENSLSEQDLTELKTEILGFTTEFIETDFSKVYDFKYDVNGTVLKLANANILDNIDKINNSGISELIAFCSAPKSGIVIYSIDGYEDLTLEQFTGDLFKNSEYEKTQLISNELIASGDPVYKLSTNDGGVKALVGDADTFVASADGVEVTLNNVPDLTLTGKIYGQDYAYQEVGGQNKVPRLCEDGRYIKELEQI